MNEDKKKKGGRISMQEKMKLLKETDKKDDKSSEENLQRGREFIHSNKVKNKESNSDVIKLENATDRQQKEDDDEQEISDFLKEITAPPRGKKQGRCKTTIEWQPEDYELLAKACSKTNLSMSEFIRKCVKRVLDKM